MTEELKQQKPFSNFQVTVNFEGGYNALMLMLLTLVVFTVLGIVIYRNCVCYCKDLKTDMRCM